MISGNIKTANILRVGIKEGGGSTSGYEPKET
jgi:hypothetical protein